MAKALRTLVLKRVHQPASDCIASDVPLAADEIARRLLRLCVEEFASDYTRQWAAGWIGGFQGPSALL